MAAAGEEVHVVHGADDRDMPRYHAEKRLELGKSPRRMQAMHVDDVGGEEVMQQVSAMNAPVAAEIVEAGWAGHSIRRESVAQLILTKAPAKSVRERAADGSEFDGRVLDALFRDEHPRVVAETKQFPMKAKRGIRPAHSIEPGDVNDSHKPPLSGVGLPTNDM
jgi:hypothetical protein